MEYGSGTIDKLKQVGRKAKESGDLYALPATVIFGALVNSMVDPITTVVVTSSYHCGTMMLLKPSGFEF